MRANYFDILGVSVTEQVPTGYALDLSTGKVIATIMPEKGHPRSLSRPIFVDDRHLKYVERRDDEKSYNLWIYDVEAQHGQVVSKISDADIEAAKPSIVGE